MNPSSNLSDQGKSHLQRIQEEKNRLAKLQEDKLQKAKIQQAKIQQAKVHDTQKIRLQFQKEVPDLSRKTMRSTQTKTFSRNLKTRDKLDHGPLANSTDQENIYSPLATMKRKSPSSTQLKGKNNRLVDNKLQTEYESTHKKADSYQQRKNERLHSESINPMPSKLVNNQSCEEKKGLGFRDLIFSHPRLVIPMTLLVLYLLGALYFSFHFLPNAVWGSFSLAFSTPDHASAKVHEQVFERPLRITENEQEMGQLKLGDLNPQIQVSHDEWRTQLDKQNQWLWPISFFPLRPMDIPLENHLQIDQQKLNRLISFLKLSNESRPSSKDAYIEKSNAQFTIKEEVQGSQVNPLTLQSAIYKMIEKRQTDLDLKDAYIPPQVRAKDQDILNRQKQIQKMLSSEITLLVDEDKITIPREKIYDWIQLDDQGQGQLDKEAIENYILEEINYPYSSLYNPHVFQSTYQGEVMVQAGTFGWAVDRYTEAEQLIKDIREGAKIEREASIVGQGYQQADEFGPNYVEVDLSHQMMLIYRDHELVLDTPIVSGMVGTDTVPGAYQVWNKESPSVLKGYNPHLQLDYQQPVQYWIAFDDQEQGIHDASWQSNFGGQTYIQYGSLGCINTPPGVMGQVYDLVDYGMPVIIF